MNLYAESSAVLAWLLGEANGEDARQALMEAELVFASDLTLIESERVLIRGRAVGELSEADAAERRSILRFASARWNLLRLDGEAVERARLAFPLEPIRTLDALHLASAVAIRWAIPHLAVLSLDERVRKNGQALGFKVLPE